jgi:hypothetical protein
MEDINQSAPNASEEQQEYERNFLARNGEKLGFLEGVAFTISLALLFYLLSVGI